MAYGFHIVDGALEAYHGDQARVVIPDGVTEIDSMAFMGCQSLVCVVIPGSVKKIGIHAFQGCKNLTSATLLEGVTAIENSAFRDCAGLSAIEIPDSVTQIGSGAFHGCERLADGRGFVILRDELFWYCGSETSVAIPDGVRAVREAAFAGRADITSIAIPGGVTQIGGSAFRDCTGLSAITIPEGVTQIGYYAFAGCGALACVRIPGSVQRIDDTAFSGCGILTVVCPEGSFAERYCLEKKLTYIYDYQFEAFRGVLPRGFEKLASPFLADEEKPYIFVSYSHRDRDRVLPVIRGLYESGWRIWYDEGLTIGDRYDETLEAHVKGCAALLLFVSRNSLESFYCRENEIPWALEAGRPIVKYILDEGADWELAEARAAAASAGAVETALEGIDGLARGERRVARGISVVVDPADRDGAAGGGFAYCLYAASGAAMARAILLEARNGGCALYDAVEGGADEERLRSCACLIAFLDRGFLADEGLTGLLAEAYRAGRDIALCQLEEIGDAALPRALAGLRLMQWLNYAHGIDADMNKKLARHLQKRGCRNAAILPGFQYDRTDAGIVIRRYTGMDPSPWIEREYGGVGVVEIADEAFKNCIHLASLTIPEGVERIGEGAFSGCVALASVVLPGSVRAIGKRAFYGCGGLAGVALPEGLTQIGEEAFDFCAGLTSVAIPRSVTVIGKAAFSHCAGLAAVALPEGLRGIGEYAFYGCESLRSASVPGSVERIGDMAFGGCKGLAGDDGLVVVRSTVFCYCGSSDAVVIPEGVTRIGAFAFSGARGVTSITVPGSVAEIGYGAFSGCESVVVTCPRDSRAWAYCSGNRIPVRELKPERPASPRLRLFGRWFGGK